jgi:hypothetical protein
VTTDHPIVDLDDLSGINAIDALLYGMFPGRKLDRKIVIRKPSGTVCSIHPRDRPRQKFIGGYLENSCH